MRLGERGLDLVLELIERRAPRLARVGREPAELLQQAGEPAFAAERADPDLLQPFEARRAFHQAQQLVADVVEAFHRRVRAPQAEDTDRPALTVGTTSSGILRRARR